MFEMAAIKPSTEQVQLASEKQFPHLPGTLRSRLEYDRDKKMRKLVQTFNKADSLMSGRVTFYCMTVSLTQKLLNQVLGGALISM